MQQPFLPRARSKGRRRLRPVTSSTHSRPWDGSYYWRLPSWQRFVLRVVRGEEKSALGQLTAAALRLLSLPYEAAIAANLLLYRLGILKKRRLPATVIGVGNITVGGTGKTSATCALARTFLANGEKVAVLSRGYGGARAGVVQDGRRLLMTQEQAGDEPFLLASKLPGAAVLVGKHREVMGQAAIKHLSASVLILDDAFQYWPLHKDREIVLVDALNPFGFGHLLPRGMLREPVKNISRAHEVWLTHCDLVKVEEVQRLRRFISALHPKAPVVETVHEPVGLRDLSGQPVPLAELEGKRVLALSSIGNPQAFEKTLEKLGAVVLPFRFRDHHRYTARDAQEIESIAMASADAIVTTEKDAVRFPPHRWRLVCWVLQVQIEAVRGEIRAWH